MFAMVWRCAGSIVFNWLAFADVMARMCASTESIMALPAPVGAAGVADAVAEESPVVPLLLGPQPATNPATTINDGARMCEANLIAILQSKCGDHRWNRLFGRKGAGTATRCARRTSRSFQIEY